MTDSENGEEAAQPHLTWDWLVQRHPNCEHLEQDRIYALPKKLIRCLQMAVPGLFTNKDIAFENDLREYGTSAFVNRKPVLFEMLDSHFLYAHLFSEDTREVFPDQSEFAPEAIIDLDERIRKAQTQQARDVFTADKHSADVRCGERAYKLRMQEEIRIRLLGYTGWLVTSPQYCLDVIRLKALRGVNGPPSLDDEATTSESNQHSQYCISFRALLAKWALSSMATWEIPIPLMPSLFPGDPVPTNGIAPSGVSMFLPWPFFVDQTFQYRDLFEFYRDRNHLSHFDDWLNNQNSFGPDRCARLMEMFVYIELALKPRYGKRLKRKTEQIDRAFATFWDVDDADPLDIESKIDSVKRIRLELNRRLRTCSEAIDEFAENGSEDQGEFEARTYFAEGESPELPESE